MDVIYRNVRPVSRIRYPMIHYCTAAAAVHWKTPLSGFATAVASLTIYSLVYKLFA